MFERPGIMEEETIIHGLLLQEWSRLQSALKFRMLEIVIVDITFVSKCSIDTLELVEDLGKSD